MQVFLVDLKNKPGELARAAETIAAKGVDITGVSGTTCSDSGRAAFLTNDEATTRIAFKEAGFTYKELEATETSLRQEPGTLATAARRLADAGVNIEAIMPIGMQGNEVHVAFVTNDAAKAKQVLSSVGIASR
jgi:hypothetical protein